MGCDIHAMIEYKVEGCESWRAFGYHVVNLGRDYGMFSVMANVRNYSNNIKHIDPKGFPEDASWETVNENSYFVVEECGEDSEYISREKAEGWVRMGISEWTDERKNRVTDPDAHSHSYLSIKEFKHCINMVEKTFNYKVDPDYKVALAMLQRYKELGHESRIVFWFDN